MLVCAGLCRLSFGYSVWKGKRVRFSGLLSWRCSHTLWRIDRFCQLREANKELQKSEEGEWRVEFTGTFCRAAFYYRRLIHAGCRVLKLDILDDCAGPRHGRHDFEHPLSH